MSGEHFDRGSSREQSSADLEAGITRLNEALGMLDGAGVPLAASYVHLAIHMCVIELKKRQG